MAASDVIGDVPMKNAAEKGFATIDCGATSSVGGLEAVESLAEYGYKQFGFYGDVDTTERKVFRFGNGAKQQCLSRTQLPLNLDDKFGRVHVNVLDSDAPVLLGMDFLRKSGAKIDFAREVAQFSGISPKIFPLQRLESGHLAINLKASCE